ncbi:MAG TPA: hypothetical protein VIG49_05960, partial [Acetobacteraceae bacterium]
LVGNGQFRDKRKVRAIPRLEGIWLARSLRLRRIPRNASRRCNASRARAFVMANPTQAAIRCGAFV